MNDELTSDRRHSSLNSSMPVIFKNDESEILVTADREVSPHLASPTINEESLIASTECSGRKLKKSIGYLQSFMLLVGTIMGSTIFITPSLVINEAKDVGLSIIIWIICGIIALLGALCYCELGSAIKQAGGNYAYILRIYGPAPAFVCSWTQVLIIDPLPVAVLCIIVGNYIMKPFEEMIETRPWYPKAIATSCIIILAIVNCVSIKAATSMQCVFTICQFLTMSFIAILGFWQLGTGHVHNFENFLEDATFNLSSIGPLGAAFFASLFSYNGWQMIGNITEDMKNVERDLLLTVITAMPVIALFYVTLNVAFLTVLTPAEMGKSQAVAIDFIRELFGKNVAYIMPVLVALSGFNSANGCIFSCGRVSLAAGREGHMPKLLGMIHHRRRTPIPAICLTSLIAILLLVPDGSNLQSLINLSIIANWFLTLIVIFGIIVLRIRQPNLHRPFKVWLIIPIFMTLVSLLLVAVPFIQRPINSAVATLFIFLGLPVYFVFVYLEQRHPKWLTSCICYVTSLLKKRMNLASCLHEYS